MTPPLPLIFLVHGNSLCAESSRFVFFHVEKEIMSIFLILVPRTTQNSPRHNATHSHHITSADHHNPQPRKKETNNNHSNRHRNQHHNNNQQQMHSRKNSNNTSHRQHQATTATIVPSSCVPEHTLSRIDVRECAQRKSQAAATTAATKRTSHGIKQHGNSVAASGG